MIRLVVVENPKRWPFEIEGAEVVSARAYLVDRKYSELRRAAVFNMCRRYGYQTVGYYVSLLAAARGHRPLPSVETLQALTSTPLIRIASVELDELIQKSLSHLRSEEFRLSIYFGRNVAQRYDRLSRALFNQFPAPFLVCRFTWEDDRWLLAGIRPGAAAEIPDGHREFVLERAKAYFLRPARQEPKTHAYRFDLAVLWSPDDPQPPSNEKAIKKFVKAANRHGIGVDVIGPEDL
ncbi:MAG: RimK-like ATPgrasp N-terminal domain-containing protein, partial [Gemmatimonadota bacterium]|nr:RimK-like ATPgrasp N-terminal domain-containing protein [Gemmatimonadota bacterium]